jgi:N,N'-diacetyllegionaminate synthase
MKRIGEIGLPANQEKTIVGKILKSSINKDQAISKNLDRKPRVGVFIQVRLKSTRLKEKALIKLNGISVLQRVINNSRKIKHVDAIAITTSSNSQDQPLGKVAEENDIPIFYGDENDIIKRYIGAAEKFNVDYIVRVTGDCPVVSYEIASKLVASHIKTCADYTYIDGDYIAGINSEVYSVQALKYLFANVDTGLSEYMTMFLRNNSDVFRNNPMKVNTKYHAKNKYRLTIDYKSDYTVLEKIFTDLNIGNEAVAFEKIYQYISSSNSVYKINQDIIEKWKKISWLESDLALKINKISKLS